MIKLNQNIHGFKVRRIIKLEDLHSTLYELEHIETGAKYIHLKNKDSENTFCTSFKTIPRDSTGVAHILEHTVLTGSEKYPIKDPFFSMLKRSMNTFMNAFTSSDWTGYPFATQNKKDFYNLLSVYLDSVFFPKISELSFKQEGHRLDFDDEKLVQKGIVYNEMKGCMSSAARIMEESIKQSLFPTTTYHYNSGGDPNDIPKLSYEQFRQFHKIFYHPSNAYFYSYGNFPLQEHLKFIQDNFLCKFKKINIKNNVAIESNWDKPKKSKYFFPASNGDDIEKKYQVCVSWRLAPADAFFDNLCLEILENILIGNSSSPMRAALIESGLGSGLSDGAGLEAEFRSSIFSCGLKDISKKDALKIKEIIFKTLEDLVVNRIDKKLINAAIHKIEFNHKEITNIPYPHGLHINLNIINSWIHGGDPVQILKFDNDLQKLQKEIEKGPFLEEKIKQHFLQNKNQTFLILAPDTLIHKKQEEKIKKELAQINKKLTIKQKEKIQQDCARLQKLQESHEDLSCLPSLEIKDIPKTDKIILGKNIGNSIYYNQPTNDIIYFRACFDILDLNKKLIKLLPLFCYLLPKIGTKKLSYTELAYFISNYTGGITLSPEARVVYKKNHDYAPFVLFDAKCLYRNREKMFEIVGELISEFDFSNLRVLKNFILEYKAKLEARIIEEGHYFAMSLSARNFSQNSMLTEAWHGMHQLKNVQEVARDLNDQKLKKISQDLLKIGKNIFRKNNMRAALIGDIEKQKIDFENKILNIDYKQLDALNKEKSVKNSFLLREGWTTSTNVSFVACSFPVVKICHKDAPILFIINKILSLGFLHREIREKRGAYGGYARYDYEDGVFYFASYRDPHILSTLEIYTQAMEFIRKGQYSEDDISEAIIQACAHIDKPDSPADAAKDAFERKLVFLSDDVRLIFKKEILSATHQKIINVANKYFNKRWQDCSVAVISSDDKLKQVNKKLGKNRLKIFEI